MANGVGAVAAAVLGNRHIQVILAMTAVATLSRSGDKVLKFSVYGSTNQMLFMALPEHLQKTARTLSRAIVRPATYIFAGLLLIFVTQGAGMSDAAVGWFTGAMALIWITLSVTAERRYLMSLLNLLAHNRIKGVDMIPDVMELTRHADARVRAAAAYLGEMGSSSELDRLWEWIGDSDPDVRGQAAQAVFRLSEAAAKSLHPVRPFVDSRLGVALPLKTERFAQV